MPQTLTQTFTPSRLKVARLRLGLSLTKLAAESGISLRSLTEYEGGKRPPSAEAIRRLGETLNIPVAFFERDAVDPIPVEAVTFRKLSKVTATRRNAVLASASLTLEFFAEVDARFRLPDPRIPTLDKYAPEHAAEAVRQHWNLGDRPIPNLIHLLESKGVRVAALDHAYDDVDAFCLYRDGVPYLFLNTAKSAERQRFDAAHELGHLVLHSEIDIDKHDSKEREAEANAFASNFLMPASAVLAQSMASASVDRILRAKTFWRVSAMAMTHRLHELDLLSPWQYRATCITLSEQGYRSSEPGGFVPETSQLLRKVMYGPSTRLGTRDAAKALDVHPAEIRSFVRDLVPLSA